MSKEYTITMTTKGQITVPKEIRDKFNFSEGSRLKIYVNNDDIIIKPFTIADEFEELILADLVKEGTSQYEIEAKLLEKKQLIDKAFEKIITERKTEGSNPLDNSDIFADLDDNDEL